MKIPKFIWPLGIVAMIIAAIGAREVMAERALEQPPFTLEKSHEGYEWRLYKPYIVAEVTVTGERSQAANQGFQILAGYIFGGNQSRQSPQQSEKISMTSPVTQEPQPQGSWKVRFMMPSKFSLETLPLAKDDRIAFLATSQERYLALRFSGGWDEENLAKHRTQLQQYAASQKLVVSGQPIYAFYDAPFIPPMLRRNEVMLRLASVD